jgi:hypothetical protein
VLNYNFLPELMIQYQTQSAGQTPLAFSGQDKALRVGPAPTLLWTIYAPQLPPLIQTLLGFSGKVTYHWWTEAYSGRSSSWLETAMIYNLDPDGNVAFALSYKRGQSEDTGLKNNLFKISLTAKPCIELPSTGPCNLSLVPGIQ